MFGILLSSFLNTPKAKRELVLCRAHRPRRPKAWRTGGGQMVEGCSVFGIASRLSRAKIKCSICSSQFNTWDAQHRWALVLIVCLNRGRRFKARFVAPTGCPGIAVPPGSAHARPWRVSIVYNFKELRKYHKTRATYRARAVARRRLQLILT